MSLVVATNQWEAKKKPLRNLKLFILQIYHSAMLPKKSTPSTNKKHHLQNEWRRGRDSNPRYLSVRWFSRPVHSTTLPPLLCSLVVVCYYTVLSLSFLFTLSTDSRIPSTKLAWSLNLLSNLDSSLSNLESNCLFNSSNSS